jgi:adenylylsulfate kinase-like enzyme
VIIWFTGISGVGKTTIAKHLQKSLNNSAILIDGDAIRKINNNDLGYTKRDRDLNAKRMINLIEYLSMQKINIIVSANITSIRFRKVIKKKIKNFYEIHIFANMSSLLKRVKNVVGVDIDYIKPKKCFMYLENNSSKKNFLGNTKFIIQRIKNLLK